MQINGFLTADELATRLRVQRKSLYRMQTRGDLPRAEKFGRTSVWSITVIEAWEKSRKGHGWRKGQTEDAAPKSKSTSKAKSR